VDIYIFISIGAREQKLWDNEQKLRFVGSTKTVKNSQKKIKFFFPQTLYFSTCEALFHSIWTNNEKVIDNLIFSSNLSIFLKK